nr:stem cell tumor [Hymenolepis microstoma]
MGSKEDNILPDLQAGGFTVGSLTDEEYRQWIEATFKPIFDPYEHMKGVPSRELLNRFQYNTYDLPRSRRNDLMLFLDANRDGRTTYKEFYKVLVHKRYVDLPLYQRIAIRAMLAANPGMRLAAARTNAIKHLQMLNSIGQAGELGFAVASNLTATERLPNAITGFSGDRASGGKFQLEPDGVWPTSRKYRFKRNLNDTALAIEEEEYIPELYLKSFKILPPPIIALYIYYAVELNKRAGAEPENTLTFTTGFPYFSPLLFDPRRRKEVWRFFSYMLVHEGVFHIIFNSLMTLIHGTLMEWVHGSWRMAVLYLSGVLAGSLAASVWDSTTVAVGASGGVFAVTGAYFALSVVNWEELKHDHYALLTASSVKDKIVAFIASGISRIFAILLFSGIDLGISFYERYGLPDAPLHVTFAPTIAGLIAGVLVGVPLLRELNQRPWYRMVFWACLSVSLALFIFAIFWNVFWPGYPPQLV